MSAIETPRPAARRMADPRAWDAAFAAAAALVALAAALLPAVPQDPAYHAFADGRAFWGIPNALDVASNAAFAVVGLLGLAAALSPHVFPDRRGRAAWLVLFASVVATAAGSAFYHLAPTSGRLVWDRLPMAAGFTSLLAALLGDRFGPAVGRRLLPRLVLAGVASVLWWHLGELRGAGNLLPYLVVQAGALAAIPLLVAGGEVPGRGAWLLALGLYLSAKGLEAADRQVLAAVGASGHTLKHLAAAAGIGVLGLELRRRGRTAYRAAGAAGAARSSMLEKSLGGTKEGSALRA